MSYGKWDMFNYDLEFSVQCPKCKAKQGWQKKPVSLVELECFNCGASFVVQINITAEKNYANSASVKRRTKAPRKGV